ncbi:MAG: endonuclease/exonuclease/phosphatase family protein [Bacteroidales bacterium]|nr:endonuclease/exonuclease/phosphatase family protein [Bacteroidales bacterium]
MNRKNPSIKPLNFFYKILILINSLAVLLLILAYISPYINPLKIWIFSFIGLGYPIILLINLFFIILWIVLLKRYFLISLIAVLIGFNFIGRFIQFETKDKISLNKTAFRVLTYNVHDLTENVYLKSAKNNEIFDFLINDAPEITCIQEFHSKGKNYYFPLVFLKKKLDASNYYYQSYFGPGKNIIAGMAIFSKFPIVNKGILEHKSTRNFGIFADVISQSDTFRIYNLHLESIMLSHKELSYVKGIISNSDDVERSGNKTKRIINKFKTAFQKRATQTNIITEHIKNAPYPVIICGDFNDTPVSYTYEHISDGLNDAFIKTGSGIGRTYAGVIPAFRIDYIFYDDFFDSFNYKVEKVDISDHYPVSCYFSIKGNK